MFRNPQVPNLAIRNDGTSRFEVYVNTVGGETYLDSFKAREHPDSSLVSEQFAKEKADEYLLKAAERDFVGALRVQVGEGVSLRESRLDALLESGRRTEAARRLENYSASDEVVQRLLDS